MPLFVYIGRDGPHGLERRPEVRPRHLAHLEPLVAQGRLRLAGPLLDESGSPTGSIIVFEAGDYAEAKRIAESDPYLEEGIFETVEVHATKQVLPADGGS